MVECEDPSQCFNSLTFFSQKNQMLIALSFVIFLCLMTLNICYQLYIFVFFFNTKHLRTVLLSGFCVVAFEVLGIEYRASYLIPARQAQH